VKTPSRIRFLLLLPTLLLAVMIAALAAPAMSMAATSVPLGAAANYAVLAAAGITNTDTTTITGDVGTYPTQTEDYTAGTLTLTAGSTDYAAGDPTPQAMTDLATAYQDAAGATATIVYADAADIGGDTFDPGVYRYPSSLAITGTVTLDAQGNPNAVFIFQIDSTLITATGSSANAASIVKLINGAQASNVFWQVGSSATLGTYSIFNGTILANTSITATTGATVDGRLLAGAMDKTGAVTLDDNTVIAPVPAAAINEVTPAPANNTVGTAQNVSVAVYTSNVSDGTSVTVSLVDSNKNALSDPVTVSGAITGNAAALTLNLPATLAAGDYFVEASVAGVTDAFYSAYTVTALGVTATTATVVNGSTLQMIATVLPADAANQTVAWSVTGGTGSATIDASTGLLTATAVGTVIVTASATDGSGVTGSVTITVTPILVTSIGVTGAGGATTVVNGSTLQMNAAVLPADAASQAVTWSVTPGTGSATIDPSTGILTGLTAGAVTVTATATDGSNVTGSKAITVNPILVSSITVTGTGGATSVVTNSTLQMIATITPANAALQTVTWTVAAGTGTATIDPSTGILTGLTAGAVTVTATATDGSNVTGTEAITVNPILVSSITVTGTGGATSVVNGANGATLQMIATITPADAVLKTVTWSVAAGTDGGTATIDPNTGILTGTAVGTITVTATATDGSGITGSEQITITPILVTSIVVTAS
jgi:uncharacterized protein YjdB